MTNDGGELGNTKDPANIHPDLTAMSVAVGDLDLLPGNPRKGDVDAVARSYQQFGQRKPIVARRRQGERGVVLAGNHQLLAARKLGWSHIAVVWTDDDDVTAKAYALADNRTAELGGYDDGLLAALLRDVGAAEDLALLAATGFDDKEIARLMRAADALPGLNDPDDAPGLPAVAVSQRGDVWLCGLHRVLCGDATVSGDVGRLVAGRRADMVWTDPPYGVSYIGKTADALTIQNDGLTTDGLYEFLNTTLGNTLAVTRPGAVWFVTSPSGPSLGVFSRVLGDLKVWRHMLVWVKDQFVMGHGDYHCRYEPLFYGWTPGAAHRAPPDRRQDTVWEVPRPKRSTEHPTMKPVALVTRAIDNHTDPGDLILDPFGGSGTTLIAANDLKRTALLLELDPRYVDVICRRYQEHTGDQPILEATQQRHDFTQE